MRNILIVGGTGAVGSRIGKILARRSDIRVIVGARSVKEAQAVAAPLGAEARAVDLNMPASWDAALADVDLVLACMDQEGPDFARMVLSKGIHYVDVTAGDAFLRSVEALPKEGIRGTAVLSVGLAPGITNLLAADAAAALDSVDRIDIGLLLGLGDTHGVAAMRWTLRNILSGRAIEHRLIDFGRQWGQRRAHWMDFADQHVLNRTMAGVSAATRMTFDSYLMTAFVFALGRLFRGSRLMEDILLRIWPLLSLGSDACVAVAEANGLKDGRPARAVASFHGQRETVVTASVAATVAILLLEKEVGTGVFHIHQLFDATEIAARMAQTDDQLRAFWQPVARFLQEEMQARQPADRVPG